MLASPGRRLPTVSCLHYGLQTNVRPVGSLAASSSDTFVGEVQRGPRFAGGIGSDIIASGPALCSPLNGVGLFALNPHGTASCGLLNQNPTWNVLVGGILGGDVGSVLEILSASKPNI